MRGDTNSRLHQDDRIELLTACWNDKTVIWKLVSNKFESGYGLLEFIAYLLETGNVMMMCAKLEIVVSSGLTG